jgi:hypothetical protein
MSWHGIGFVSASTQPGGPGNTRALQTLKPSPQWTGVAGSGFTTIPNDPVRTTAKPALRLITPPFQWFTDMLEVGVIAAANDGGSLYNTLGVASIAFHYEGNSVVVDEPRWQTIQTRRGMRTYFGWWVRLKKPANTAGHGHLYIEASPRNPAMQKRVIGPYMFSPQTALFDAELTIAPSQVQITGQRYQSLTAAIAWCKSGGKVNPLLTIAEPGTYNFGTSAGESYTNPGYINVTASVPGVVLGRSAPASSGASNLLNDRSKLHLFGQNLTLDFKNCVIFEQSASSPAAVAQYSHWLDGVTMTSSDALGTDSDFAGSGVPRSVLTARLISGQPWLTEVEVSALHNSMIGAQLIRGCNAEDLGADVANSSACIVQSRFRGNDNSFWNDDRPAFDVHYSGPESSATLARSGNVLGGNGGVWTCVIGSTSYTFNTGRLAYFSPADGRYFADLVAWLNTLPGITATLRIAPFDRVASSGSLPGFVGQGFGATNIKSAPLTVVSNLDIHADFYQHPAGGNLENTIIAFNQVLDYAAQLVFLSPPNPAPRDERDVMIFGNIFHQKDGVIGASQWGRPNLPMTASHVVFAHNTFANQPLWLRNEGGGLSADAHCLVANTTHPTVSVLGTSPVPNLTITGLHLHAGAAVPGGAVSVTIGGDDVSLFADSDAFDFTPTGALGSNLKPAALPFDLNRAGLPAQTPAGALK